MVSRVRRNAPAEAMRKAMLLAATSGNTRNETSASLRSSRQRITIVPTSVSVDWKSVTTLSVTSWSSASTSLVIREMSTPAGRLS